jgi:hypothetical protein
VRVEARRKYIVPVDIEKIRDGELDPLEVMHAAMRNFYMKAKIEESLGYFCDFRNVDQALRNAAQIAREIANFKHPRLSAVKLAVADPNAEILRGDMTAAELREIMWKKLQEEGFKPALEHQGLVNGGEQSEE